MAWSATGTWKLSCHCGCRVCLIIRVRALHSAIQSDIAYQGHAYGRLNSSKPTPDYWNMVMACTAEGHANMAFQCRNRSQTSLYLLVMSGHQSGWTKRGRTF